MTQKHKSPKPKTNIIIAIVIFLVVAILTFFIIKIIARPHQPETASPAQSTNTESINTNTEPTTPEGDIPESSGQTPPQYAGPDVNTSANLTGFITYQSISDGILTIHANIDQFLSSGTCGLTLSSDTGIEISRTSSITPNPSYSECDNFTIPTSELAAGHWNIIINLSSQDKTGTIKGEITI